MRFAASIGMPAASSRAKPSSACAMVGCACSDSGDFAASTFMRNGSEPSTMSMRVPPSARSLGSAGCAPSQSSASGAPVGVVPSSPEISPSDPQA